MVLLAGTVFLHVGVAKTGTSYLQRILAANKSGLRSAGVLYPGRATHAHFQAALDLRGGKFQGHTYPRAAGMWSTLAAEVNAFRGNAVISHELLARTREEARARAVGDLDTDDVRVVITARDLARQVPAVWQENLKNRNEEKYEFFLQAIFEQHAADDAELAAHRAARFWRAQDVVGVAERWAQLVGPGAVTVVTVPHFGAEPDELWRRFAHACQLPAADCEISRERENQSMGAAESEVLRRMNSRFSAGLPWPRYETLVKRQFATSVLAAKRSHGGLVVPAAWWEATRQAADRQIRGLEAAGYLVVGDLEELRPQLGDTGQRSPDEFTDPELLDVALELLARVAATEPRPAQPTTVVSDATDLVRRTVRGWRRD